MNVAKIRILLGQALGALAYVPSICAVVGLLLNLAVALTGDIPEPPGLAQHTLANAYFTLWGNAPLLFVLAVATHARKRRGWVFALPPVVFWLTPPLFVM